jgi:SAM-dependent methyltransferase
VNTYRGLHAHHYDLLYAEKPYLEEARYVDKLLRETGVARGRLLDLACGTGRHADAFARFGWDVTGVDFSEDLLEHARLNVPDVRFLLQDMRELDLPGEQFNAVTCLFDSIGYPLDDEGVVATLAGAARHLAPDGALAVEFLHAPALLADAAPYRVRRVDLPADGDELLRISRTSLDENRRVMDVEFELIELHADGTYERWLESQSNRFFLPSEMEALLERAGLRAERFLAAYQEDAPLDETTFHVIVVSKRGS